jgi:hypothetical protein
MIGINESLMKKELTCFASSGTSVSLHGDWFGNQMGFFLGSKSY